jgi:hypothetical protein
MVRVEVAGSNPTTNMKNMASLLVRRIQYLTGVMLARSHRDPLIGLGFNTLLIHNR